MSTTPPIQGQLSAPPPPAIYAPPGQPYATPNATLSTVLPYGGASPPTTTASYPAAYSQAPPYTTSPSPSPYPTQPYPSSYPPTSAVTSPYPTQYPNPSPYPTQHLAPTPSFPYPSSYPPTSAASPYPTNFQNNNYAMPTYPVPTTYQVPNHQSTASAYPPQPSAPAGYPPQPYPANPQAPSNCYPPGTIPFTTTYFRESSILVKNNITHKKKMRR